MRHVLRFAPVVIPLLLALAPPASALDGFDFAVERLEVIGNGAFVDEFDDGLRDVGPTSLLVDRGGSRTTESAGLLRLTDRDGAQVASPPQIREGRPFANDWFQDEASLTTPIVEGGGSSEIRAHFRPDVPPDLARYGLALSSFGPIVPSGTPPVPLFVERSANAKLSLAGQEIDPALVQGSLILRLVVDDAPPLAPSGTFVVSSGFSIDGGASFQIVSSGATIQPASAPARMFASVWAGGVVDASFHGASEADDLVRGPGGALQSLTASLFESGALGSPLTPIGAAQAGSLELASAGSGDLRSTPGGVALTVPDGEIAGTAIRVNEVRRVDVATGRPLAADAPGSSCTTGTEPDCWTPGRPLAQNQRAFDEICRWGLGFTALDRSVCALNVYGSGALVGGISVSNALSVVLGGGFFSGPVLMALSGNAGFRVPLRIDPADGTAVVAGGVSQTSSEAQEALLGCGSFFGTVCDGSSLSGTQPGGIRLLHSEATALLQAFVGQDGTDDTWLANDATRTQPGTVPLPGGPVFETPCTRSDGVQVVALPGCRGPGMPGHDPLVDGTTTGLVHPHTAQPFASELAALSFNLQGLHTAMSSPDSDGAIVPGTSRFRANEPDEFDEFAPLRTDGCSHYAPSLCSGQRALRDLSVRELADDPSGPPARRWVWETGAEYAVTSATGRFAAFAGGRIQVLGPAEPRLPGFAAGASVLLEAPGFPDADADGVADANDTCPHLANSDQSDVGGVGAGSPPDGVGDACQCGDVSGDGRVTVADAVTISRSLLVPATATLARPELCDVGGSAGCSASDAVILRRALLSPPTATIGPSCAPANP
jgi:hypothetical protein